MKMVKKEFMSAKGKQLSTDAYLVKIYNDASNFRVEGVSKNPINFKLSAKWADLFNGLIPGAELLAKTGDASLTTGIFSQKYFQGGNNLDMTVEFRLYDNGDTRYNPVIKSAKDLAKMTVADTAGFKNVEAGLNAIGDQINNTAETIKNIGSGDITLKQGLNSVVGGAIERMAQRAVTLDISGGLFKCTKMVIQDVNVTYSGAQTHTGPLYGDFSVGLISLQAITRGGGAYGVDSILTERTPNILIDGRSINLDPNKSQGE